VIIDFYLKGLDMRTIAKVISSIFCFVLLSILMNNLTYSISKSFGISDDFLFFAGISVSIFFTYLIIGKIFTKKSVDSDVDAT
jgi:hypothetical protein